MTFLFETTNLKKSKNFCNKKGIDNVVQIEVLKGTSHRIGILASSIKITDTKVEYIEYKDDGAYFVEETISGNIITSDFYKISNGEKIHSSQIISSVSGKNVISRETDANGQVTTYSVKGIVSRDTNEKSIAPYAIRTDNYSISLVGKKVTIASAAMAITLVSNYIPTTGAEDIIKKAIVVVAGAVGAGVACLPDYLYVTSVLSCIRAQERFTMFMTTIITWILINLNLLDIGHLDTVQDIKEGSYEKTRF